MNYFSNKVSSKTDIERHRAEERRLDAQIAELEKETDEFSVAVLKAVRNIRAQLLVSKANAVNSIGRKV